MAKESIRKIRDAELAAANITADAEKKAADTVYIAEQRGKAHLEKTLRDAEADKKQKLDEIRLLTEEKLNSSRDEAEKAAKQLRRIARPHVRDAVKLIIQGIIEQCQ